MILGFRIDGLESLNVLQNFQLLLKSFNVYAFEISDFIHGYTNSASFVFLVPLYSNILKNFNFMFLAILFLIMLIFFLELLEFSSLKKN